MKHPIAVGLVIAAFALAGCNDKEQEKDVGGSVLDANIATNDLLPIQEDAMVGDAGVPVCGPNLYPCGPYGTMLDDVAKNLEFIGYADPEEHCKDHADKVMDLNTRLKVSFKDYFQGGDCPTAKKKLLWVMVSAGWCGPCQEEVQATQKEYVAGHVDSRIAIVNIVFENDLRGDPVTDLFIKKWITKFKLTFPTVMDPSFKMGEYFDAAATPFNMLVDLSTMKIFFQQTGGNLSAIGAASQEFLNK